MEHTIMQFRETTARAEKLDQQIAESNALIEAYENQITGTDAEIEVLKKQTADLINRKAETTEKMEKENEKREAMVEKKADVTETLTLLREEAIERYKSALQQYRECVEGLSEMGISLPDCPQTKEESGPETVLAEEQTLHKPLKDSLLEPFFMVLKKIKETKKEELVFDSSNAASELTPIIPYPGGKSRELKYIYPALPSYRRLYEPFVGGGSVFMGLQANEYFINDFSTDLIDLYKCIESSDEEFCRETQKIDNTLQKAIEFGDRTKKELIGIYKKYKRDTLQKKELKKRVGSFCKKHRSAIEGIMDTFPSLPCIVVSAMEECITRKIINHVADKRDDSKLEEYLLTAVQQAVYNNYRQLFNNAEVKAKYPKLYSAIFLYIRERAYKNGFSYNKKGEYNSSYGGANKNRVLLSKRMEYLGSDSVVEHFSKTKIYNLDFEDFLKKTSPTEQDFVFLDPPYDESYNSYHNSGFTKEDHQRLASYLLNECKAKWMMIIKETDFILNLYNQEGIYIERYNKKYSYCKKEEKTTHLLITNYPLAAENQTKKRNRVKYQAIQQLTLDGTFVKEWKNITEICKANPSYRHASISKCVAGKYSKAYNHRWKGVKGAA